VKSRRLDDLVRTGIAFDLETHMSQPGLSTPPIVCGSLASVQNGRIVGNLGSRDEAIEAFDHILKSDLTICGANISYDVRCIMVDGTRRGIDRAPTIFHMYDPTRGAVRGDVDGRVLDVQILEQLHAIAKGYLNLDPRTGRSIINPETGKKGRYSLAAVVDQVLGRNNAKVNDKWRKSYALLENMPIDQWPSEARTYPIDDAVNTLEAALAQTGHMPNVGMHEWMESTGMGSPPHCVHCGALPGGVAQCTSVYRRLNTHDLSRQTYFSLCIDLGAQWGYRIDQNAVDALEQKYNLEHDGMMQPFIDAGILRPDGTQNENATKRIVAGAFGSVSKCPVCVGTGKVPSPKTAGRTKINCKACDGTTLLLLPECPRSESGEVSISRDALNQSGVELLVAFADWSEGKKIKTVYIPYLRNTEKDKVTTHRDVPRLLRPNPIVETGRASYDGATMLLPRHGGVRECHVPRPGYRFSSVDYKAGELVTHAQSCLILVGASELAKALNKGLDAHLALAGTILGVMYEDCTKRKKAGDHLIIDTRQVCKPPNFGFPGRMGAFKLVVQQRKQNDVHTPHPNGPQWIFDNNGKRVRGYKGLRFCIFMNRSERCGEVLIDEWKGRKYDTRVCKKCVECAQELKVAWLKQWPENVPYFDIVKRVDESGKPVVQHMSNRLRGFRHGQVDDDGEPINSGNAIANGYFQALLADAAKNAYMAATRECFDRTCRVESFTNHISRFEGGPSPLLGSHLNQFQHDEAIGEHPISVASDAVLRVSELFEESLRIACPDMDPAVEAQPTLMDRLYKGAEPICVDRNGKPCKYTDPGVIVLPWVPKEIAA
jgi:hypothetical protein